MAVPKVTSAAALDRRRKRRVVNEFQSAIEQRLERKLRADDEIAAGALEEPLDSLDSFASIRRRVALGYHRQRYHGGALQDDPSSLMFRALQLAKVSDGLRKAELREMMPMMGKERFHWAFEKLCADPRVRASKEVRHNRAGRNQLQWVVRLKSPNLHLASEDRCDN